MLQSGYFRDVAYQSISNFSTPKVPLPRHYIICSSSKSAANVLVCMTSLAATSTSVISHANHTTSFPTNF
jgi:hypothetical protein